MRGVNFLKLKGSWAAIRWKILIIFTFFSIVSVIMVTSFSVAVLNVVIDVRAPT